LISDGDLRLDAHRYTHTDTDGDTDIDMIRHSDTRTCTGSHSYLLL